MGIANLVSNSIEKETKVMWCKNCNLETNEAICPVCGLETSEDLPVEINWCNDCRIPVFQLPLRQIKVFAQFVMGRLDT